MWSSALGNNEINSSIDVIVDPICYVEEDCLEAGGSKRMNR